MDGVIRDRPGDSALAGMLGIAGAGTMLLGAGIWASTGADIDVALVREEMPAYLAAAADHRTALVANLCLWIVGVLGLGAAGTMMARTGDHGPLGDLSRFVYWVATTLAISAFLAWLAIVVQVSASATETEVAIARVVGWYAYRADVVATALIVGVGPMLVAAAGKRTWVPGWLYGWGVLAALTGVLSVVPYFLPAVPLALGFVIVPVGIGWTLAAGIVLLRRRS